MKKLNVAILFVFAILLWFSSCKKSETFYSGKSDALRFSSDTVFFDTVFTRLPGSAYPRSVNKQFFIVNKQQNAVKATVFLGGGDESPYRINLDGVAGVSFSDIVIPQGDSLICFVEVTIEPNNLLNPAIILDSIVFTINGNQQQVILGAYGWDAQYFRAFVFEENTLLSDATKPIVIVNSVLVAENVTVEIGPDVHIYSSPTSVFYVRGTLKVLGTVSNPVVFQGDRLQPSFKEVAGQWVGIHLLSESKDNLIENCLIKNAQVGVRVDSLPVNSNPKLRIAQVEIRNSSFYGLLGITTHINAQNMLIGAAGSYGFLGYWGGNYDFKHCSFTSGFKGFRTQPAFVITNQELDENDRFVRSFPIAYTIENSVIYGPLDDELILDIHPSSPPSVAVLSHSLIKTDLYKDTLSLNSDLIINQNPLFENPREGLFKPRSDSPLRSAGKNLSPPIASDLQGNIRGVPPTIGAIE